MGAGSHCCFWWRRVACDDFWGKRWRKFSDEPFGTTCIFLSLQDGYYGEWHLLYRRRHHGYCRYELQRRPEWNAMPRFGMPSQGRCQNFGDKRKQRWSWPDHRWGVHDCCSLGPCSEGPTQHESESDAWW